jgi:hypothetical protein
VFSEFNQVDGFLVSALVVVTLRKLFGGFVIDWQYKA